MRPFILALPLLLAACAGHHARRADAAPPRALDLRAFFVGGTRGAGRLDATLRPARAVAIRGTGRIEGDLLVIDQDVTVGDAAPRRRQWRLRETAPGLWIGSLSDAAGPVVAEVKGAQAVVTVPLAGGAMARQRLTLAPDGRSVADRVEVQRQKLHLAALTATIVRD